MKRRPISTLLATLVLVAVPLTACGDDDEPSGNDAGSTTTEEQREEESTTTTAEEAALDPQEALLALEDLPAGYAEEPADDDEDDDDSPTQSCPRLQALDEEEEEPLDKATVGFSAGEAGPLVEHSISVLPEGRAEEALEEFRGALDDPACATFTQPTDEGQTATYTLTEVSVPALGDDTVGLRVTGDAVVRGVTVDLVLERLGDVGSSIQLVTVPGLSAPAPDLDALVRRADEKLQAAS